MGAVAPAYRTAGAVGLVLCLILVGFASLPAVSDRPVHSQNVPAALADSTQLLIQSFQFSPPSFSTGSTSQASIQLSGGTPPYYAWVNNSPAGCQPSGQPVMTSSATIGFACSPSSSGIFTVQLDVADSSAPVNHASQTASVTVTSNNNNNNGNNSGGGKGGNGSSLIPSGLLTVVTLLAFVLLGAVVAIAAGTIAIAIVLARRLRQLNETLAKLQPPSSPESPKPPG